jgi:hypothetical protein
MRRRVPTRRWFRGPDHIDRALRRLFVQRVLEGDREPASVVAALDWAHREVQRRSPRAASRVPQTTVDALVRENLDFAVAMSIRGVDVQRPGVLEHEGRLRAEAQDEIGSAFERPLEDLLVLRAVAAESCERFHAACGDATSRHEVLARLTARGLLLTYEVHGLLIGGYPSGALARWRSLHESSVVAAVLAASDETTAQRYLEHEVIGRVRAARDYQVHASTLGNRPLESHTLAELEDRRRRLLAQYGKPYDTPFGWAAHLVPSPNFRTLEEFAGRDWLHPYYEMANHPVHAGSRNLLNEIGVDNPRVMLTGPSVSGMTDPLQLTVRSLVFLVRQLLEGGPDHQGLEWMIQIEALERLGDRLVEALPDERADGRVALADATPNEDEDEDGDELPSLLSWPEISWTEVSRRAARAGRRDPGA